MRTSEQINEIATALAKAQGEMGAALKDATNPFFKSKYADLASVWDACRGPLTKHGLSIAQFPTTEYSGTPEIYKWTSKMGEERAGVRVICIVSVVTRLLHTSGQFLEDTSSAMLPSGDPQAVGSAITYLRRYSLQSIAGVAPEDDDGNAASQPQTAKAATLPVQEAAPKGFDAWLMDLEATADTGSDALKAAWVQSRPEYRQHLTKTNNAAWERLKAHAASRTPVGV